MTESTPEGVADGLRQEVRNTVHINGKDVQWPGAIPLGSEYIQHGEFFFTERGVWKYTMSGWTSLTEFMGKNCLGVREFTGTPGYIKKHKALLEKSRYAKDTWAQGCGPFYMVHKTIFTADGEIVPHKITLEKRETYEEFPLIRTIYPYRDILALGIFDLGGYVKKLSGTIQKKLQAIFEGESSSFDPIETGLSPAR